MEKILVPDSRPRFKKSKEEWTLFLDGCQRSTWFNLSEIGAETIRMALCQLPIYIHPIKFWGYNISKTDSLIDRMPKAGDSTVYLASRDPKAIEVIADVLCDPRCWDLFEPHK